MLNFYIWIIQFLAFIIGIYCLSEEKLGGKLFFAMLLGGIVIISPLFNILGIATAFVSAFFLIFCLYLKTKKIAINITITFISILLLVVSDFISQMITAHILGELIEVLRQDVAFFVLVPVISLIITMILNLLMRVILKKLKIYDLFKNKYGLIVTGFIVLTLAIFYANIFIGQYLGYNSQMIQWMGILYLLYGGLLVGLFFLFSRIIRKEMRVEKEQLQMESDIIQAKQLREYTEKMEESYEEMRSFRHDYKNMLLGLTEYIRTNNMKGLESYFSKNIEPINREMDSNNYKLGVLKNLYIQEIKGLIASKLIKSQELKINTIIEVVEPIGEIETNMVELCKGLGIILDNAIEEAVESKEPKIYVAFIKKEESILIIVTNSCRDKIPLQRQMYTRGFSTKGEGRGLGLSTLEEIVEKSSNIQLDTYVENGNFEQHLEIFNRGG